MADNCHHLPDQKSNGGNNLQCGGPLGCVATSPIIVVHVIVAVHVQQHLNILKMNQCVQNYK